MSIETILGAPQQMIPRVETQAYDLLMLLAERESVSEYELMLKFGGRQRSPLQYLSGDKYGYWLIHAIKDEKGVITARKLDDRHKSGIWSLDQQAREERKRELKKDSFFQALNETVRLPKARKEYLETKEKGSEQ